MELDQENLDFKEIESQLTQEIEADQNLPKDHPERKKFEDML